jgi:molecular chaperone GrpE
MEEKELTQEEEKKEEQRGEAEKTEKKAEEKAAIEELESKLKEAQAKADEYLDQWRRTAADFSNYRKLVAKEKEDLTKTANAVLLARLLPILDDFERAFKTIPDHLDELTWVEGIALIYRKLQTILEQEGVKPIQAEGKEFDPMYHEAITYEEVEGYEDGQIIEEVQKGYMLGDKVLRPSIVRVAKKVAPKKSEEKSEEPQEKKEEKKDSDE